MPGFVLVGLFIMALIAPSFTAMLIVVTCHRYPTRLWIVGAVAELITLGLSFGTIAYTHYVGWWDSRGAMVGFVMICILAVIVNVLGFFGVLNLKEYFCEKDSAKLYVS
jgi:hypothetical protein